MEPATLALSGVIFIMVAAMRFITRDPYARARARICARLALAPAPAYADEVLQADVDVFEGQHHGYTIRLCWSLWLAASAQGRTTMLARVRPAAAVAPPPPPPRVCLMLEGLPPAVSLLALAPAHAEGLGERLRGFASQDLKAGDPPFDRALRLRGDPLATLGALRPSTRAALRAAVEAAGAGVLLWRGRLYGFAPLPIGSAEAAARLLDAATALADDLRFDPPPADPFDAACALLNAEPSHRVRTQCAALLRALDDPKATPALRQAQRDPHPAVRLEAALALHDLAALRDLACDAAAADRIRCAALRAVAQAAPPTLTWDAARGVLATSDGKALTEALTLLTTQPPDDTAAASANPTDTTDATPDDPNTTPLLALLRALLDRLGPATPPVASAVAALHQALTPHPTLYAAAQPLLIAWLHADDPDTQQAAAAALGDLGDLAALEALTTFTHSGHPTPTTRRTACAAADHVRARFPDCANAGALALISPTDAAGNLSLPPRSRRLKASRSP